jgi:hypothetical protein
MLNMSQETTVILRSVLFQLRRAKTLNEAVFAVRAMCSKDDIAAVEQEINALEEDMKKDSQ